MGRGCSSQWVYILSIFPNHVNLSSGIYSGLVVSHVVYFGQRGGCICTVGDVAMMSLSRLHF